MINKTRDQLAQHFMEALNQGQLPWAQCWRTPRPVNATTGKLYRGVNTLILSVIGERRGYTDPRWCTYNQAQSKQWQVRKGEKSVPVEYWAYYDREQKKLLSWPEAKRIMRADPEYAEENLLLKCRTHYVFNAEQIDGIEPLKEQNTSIGDLRIRRDTLLQNMGVGFREQGTEAYYSPGTDTVTLPKEATFDDIYSYMATLLHECGHATGHSSRLNRDLTGRFGSEDYAREELRAEIASAFTAQELGLVLDEQQLSAQLDRHAAYIQNWAQLLKEAPEELFRAIKDAEKISDYIVEKGQFHQDLSLQEVTLREPPQTVPAPAQTASFSPEQLEALRYCSREGFTVEQEALVANPEFTPLQMDIVRTALSSGIALEAVRQFAVPDKSPGEMLEEFRQLREAPEFLPPEPRELSFEM